MFTHPDPPLDINGTDFSAIELLEAGIAHPMVTNYVSESVVDDYTFMSLVIGAATGYWFDHAKVGNMALHEDNWAARRWQIHFETLNDFFRAASDDVIDRIFAHIRYGRHAEALNIVNKLNDLRLALAGETLPPVALAAD